MRNLAILLTLAACGLATPLAAAPVPSVDRWAMLEVAVSNDRSYANPFADVSLEATLTSPSGHPLRVPGFYDGGHTWRLRFMPDEVGRWRYQARFSDGAPGVQGEFQCVKGRLHGPLRVSAANPLWFEYADGRPAYLLAAHLWSIEQLDPVTLAKTLDFLAGQGFNAVVGPHLAAPDRLPWARTADGQVDFARFNLSLWQQLDAALQALGKRGMVLIPFSVFGGTNGLPKAPRQDRALFLRYWVARWGGCWNATFQPVSEWEEGYPEDDILRIGAILHDLDGGRHLISVHSLRAGSAALQQAGWYAYHTIQDKLTDQTPLKYTWLVNLYRQAPKPILAHECLWEGNLYQREAGLDVDNLRRAAWTIALCGGQINYADEVIAPRRFMRREDSNQGLTFAERGLGVRPSGQFYRQLKVLGDFMRSLPFSQMAPQPELASTGICLAQAGHTYAVYAPHGGRVELDLAGAPANVSGRWLNPHDGRRGKPFAARGGGKRAFEAPDGDDWVLLLTAGR